MKAEQTTKAILVVDVPKNCEECKFFDGDCCYATAEKKWGGLSCRGVDHWKIREKWCPLKPIPDRIKHENASAYKKGFANGFNTCVDILEIYGDNK